MDHLINHIGHFPMGIGAARLSSMVCEHDDLPNFQGDELSAELFHSPAVQFFMLNKDTLMSLVELPTLEALGGSSMSGLRTARSQVDFRFVAVVIFVIIRIRFMISRCGSF